MSIFMVSLLLFFTAPCFGMEENSKKEFEIDAPVLIKTSDGEIMLEGIQEKNDNFNYDYLNCFQTIRNIAQDSEKVIENKKEYYDITEKSFPITFQALETLISVIKALDPKKIALHENTIRENREKSTFGQVIKENVRDVENNLYFKMKKQLEQRQKSCLFLQEYNPETSNKSFSEIVEIIHAFDYLQLPPLLSPLRNLFVDALLDKKITSKDVRLIMENKSLALPPSVVRRISYAAIKPYAQNDINYGSNHSKVLFSPNGTLLICKTDDVHVSKGKKYGIAHLWDVKNKKRINSFECVGTDMTFNPKGDRFAYNIAYCFAKSWLFNVKVAALDNFKLTANFLRMAEKTTAVAFTPQGNLFFFSFGSELDGFKEKESGSVGETIFTNPYVEEEKFQIFNFSSHSIEYQTLLLMPDEKTAFIAGKDNTICMYELGDDKLTLLKKIPMGADTHCADVNYKNGFLVTLDYQWVNVWDVNKNICVYTNDFSKKYGSFVVDKVSFSPDGTLLGLVGFDDKRNNIIELIETKQWNSLCKIQGDKGGGFYSSLSFSPKGKRIAVAGDGLKTKIWNIPNPKLNFKEAIFALYYKQNNGTIEYEFQKYYQLFSDEIKKNLPPVQLKITNMSEMQENLSKNADRYKAALFGNKSSKALLNRAKEERLSRIRQDREEKLLKAGEKRLSKIKQSQEKRLLDLSRFRPYY